MYPFLYLMWMSMFRNGAYGNGCECGNAQLNTIQDTLNSQATNRLVLDEIKGNACALGSVKDAVLNQGWANQLSNCQQTNSIERGFAQTNYNMAEQSCAIKQATKDNTSAILAKLDSIEDSRKDREIATLTAQLATVNARAERQAELAPIVAQLTAIRSAQPNTITLPYSCATAVPTSMVYGSLGLNGLNGYNGTGVWG